MSQEDLTESTCHDIVHYDVSRAIRDATLKWAAVRYDQQTKGESLRVK